MLWRVSRPIRTRSKPPGFILPCQPALADRPPCGLDLVSIRVAAQVLLTAPPFILDHPCPAFLSLAAFSQRAASIVRSTTRQSICRRSLVLRPRRSALHDGAKSCC